MDTPDKALPPNAGDTVVPTGLIKVNGVVVSSPIPDVEFTKFDSNLGVFVMKINTYNQDLIDFIRVLPTRAYQSATKLNFIGTQDYPKVVNWLVNNSVTYVIADGVSDAYVEFQNRPDYFLTLDARKNKVLIRRKSHTIGALWSHKIPSLTNVANSSDQSVAIGDLYLIPSTFADWNIGYDSEVKEILNRQLEQRAELLSLATAEDAVIENLPPAFDKLRPFQRVALKFIEAVKDRAILAYDMGLGKTPMSIAKAEQVIANKPNAKILIVCPATLKYNWYREIQKWTGREAVMLAGSAPDEVSIKYILSADNNYYIINYDVIGRAKNLVDKDDDKNANKDYVMPWVITINFMNNASGPDLTIFDEGHYMKNVGSQRSRGGRAINSQRVIALTGTPIVNRPEEIWPLLNIIDNETFKSRDTFISQYLSSDGKSVKNNKQFQDLLLNYMIRRRKSDVIKDLPAIERIDHLVDLSPRARVLYEKVLAGLYISLKNPNYIRDVNSILAEIMRLKQICAADKVESTIELAQNIIEDSDSKVLIFSQFVETCREIHSKIDNSLIITGEDKDNRYSRIDEFQNNPDVRAMVLSTKAGAEGLTLTAASYVIFNDYMWTPKDHIQAEARCYGRMNDLHGATAYYVQARNTIEQYIVELLSAKMTMIESTIDDINTSARANESIIKDLIEKMRG